jgi:lipoprotein signal peptidase
VTETTTPEPSAEASDVVAHEPQPDLLPPAAPPEPGFTVPGDRLGVPAGSTRVIADYGRPRPSYVFLALVSILTVAADIGTKSWAEHHLDGYPGTVELWKNHLTLLLAKNRGGAWGLLQSTSENVRRPFFLLVSVAAIAFIMTLYRRLQARQRALQWGLPLVLGGALGNVFDRIRYGHVIDFIDAHVYTPGGLGARLLGSGEHHWPTFNVADIAICVGVGLMAIDMFTSKRGHRPVLRAPRVPPAQSGEPSVGWNGVLQAAEAFEGPVPGGGAEPAPSATEGHAGPEQERGSRTLEESGPEQERGSKSADANENEAPAPTAPPAEAPPSE